MPSVRAAEAAAASLARLYGPRVELRYHNVDDLSVQQQQQATLDYFAAEEWPLPVTLLNGELLFVGGLQPLKLVAAVARAMEDAGEMVSYAAASGTQR